MLSLIERLELLEGDLAHSPPRISVYRDLPFAILRYDPGDEWTLRTDLRRMRTRLQQAGRTVEQISLAALLWEAIERSEGLDAVIELERTRGFAAAQEQVATYLSDRDWWPLPELLAERLAPMDPRRNVAFLVRAAAMAPSLYHMSRLLDEMQGRTQVPTVLFYPGGIEGATGLRFMDQPNREAIGNYRVKIYS